MPLSGQCNADAGPNFSVCAGTSFTLGATPSATGDNPIAYDWDASAGADPADVANPSLTVNTPGTYTYTLAIEDDDGCTDTDPVTVTVLAAPNANFNFGPDGACAGTPVNFVNTTTGCAGCTYAWNFDNPTSGSANNSGLQNPVHTFVATGSTAVSFDVSLTVTASNGCTDAQVITVDVDQSPAAVLTEDVNFTQCLGFNDFYAYVYDNSSPANNASYVIDWGDGSPDYNSAAEPNGLEHIYSGVNIWDLTYTVTGLNGCTDTESYVVTNITNPAIGAGTGGNTLQCGPVDMCFDLTNWANNHPSTVYIVDFGDGSGTVTYNHPPPASVCHEYSTSSCPGSFTFEITADNNCPISSEATITPIQIYAPPAAQFTNPPNGCAGAPVPFSNTTVPGFNLSCNSSTNYAWNFGDPASGAANTSAAVNPTHVYAAPGTYTITLTATNGGNPLLSCGSTVFTSTVCIDIAPSPSFTVSNNLGCVPMVITTDNLSTTGVTCPTTRTWNVTYSDLPCDPDNGAFTYSGGTTAASPEPQYTLSSVGTYTINLQLQNACGTFTDSETVTVNTVPVVALSSLPAICAGSSTNPSSSVDPCNLTITSYAWTFPGGSPSGSTSALPGPVSYATPGTYSIGLTATNACGPGSSATGILVNSIPNAGITTSAPGNEVCAGALFSLTGTGGTSYTWTGPGLSSTTGATVNASLNASGTYSVTVSNGNCSDTEQVTLSVNPLPVLTADASYSICLGQSVVLSATAAVGEAPFSGWNWTPAATLTGANTPNPTATPVATGTTTYTVGVTDNNGCLGSGTVPVVVNPIPVVNAGPDITLCNQPVATTLIGFSPAGGTWSGSSQVTASGVFTPATTGPVTLTYSFTNASGCADSDQMVVNVVAPTLANAGPDQGFCQGASPAVLVPVTPGGTWSGIGVNAGGTFTPGAPGMYVLTYSLGTGTCLTQDQVAVEVYALPVVNAGTDAALCLGQSVTLNGSVSGGETPYGTPSWTNAATLSSSSVLNPVATPASTTTYTLTVGDNNGCSASDPVVLTVNALPAVDAGDDITLCNQPVATTLTGFSPAGGTWSGSSLVTATGVFTPSGTGVFPLTYTFTNANGCVNQDVMNVTVVGVTPADAGPDLELCFNEPSVTLPSGGTWSGAAQVTPAGLFTPNAVGLYTLTFSVGTGSCLTTDQLQVEVMPLPVTNAGSDQTICAGQTVQLNATVTGNNGPVLVYSWSGGTVSNANATNPTASPMSTTTYTVNVVDSLGCADPDQVTIFVNPLPVVNAGPDITLCNQPLATTLTGFSPAGGTWSGSSQVTASGVFTPATTGPVTLTYSFTNASGCADSDQMVVNVVAPTLANAGPDQGFCQGASPAVLVPVTPGGTWSGTGVNAGGTFTPGAPGMYVLTYSLGTGTCLTQDQVAVEVFALPVVNAGPDAALCLGQSVILNGSVSGGETPYGTPSWTNAATLSSSSVLSPVATPASTTTYTLTVGDNNGCSASDQVVLTVNALPVVNAGPDITLCNQPIAAPLNGFSPAGGTWSGSTLVTPAGVFTPSGTGAFTLTYTFTNAAGCVSSDNAVVTVVAPVMASAGPDVALCQNEGVFIPSGYVPAAGGAWSGTGITNASTGLFNPTTSGVGTFTITLQFGSGTCLTSDQLVVTVSAPPAVAAGPPVSVCGNVSPFDFTGDIPASGGTWEGNGITDAAQGTFDPGIGTGSYSLLYWYTDAITGCADSALKSVTVNPVPSAAFALPPLWCTGAGVDIVNNSTGAVTYTWSFGNGATGTGPDPSYLYVNEGVYDVQLVAANTFFCSDTAVHTHEIISAPEAALSLIPAEGCAPLEVLFENQSTGLYLSYLWDYAIGTSSEAAPGLAVFPQADDVIAYPVTLTATNLCGSDTAVDEVLVYPQPVAAFGTNLDVFCSPFTVVFNNTSVGNPDQFLWDFGDGTSSSLEEPGAHVFLADSVPVNYTIGLYLENECGTDSAQYSITVLPNTVTAFFNTDITAGCAPLEVAFTDFSEGGTAIQYDFDDGTFTGAPDPVHVFTEPGLYIIEQSVNNGCSFDTTSITIEVFGSPELDFTAGPSSLCVNESVSFDASPGGAVSLVWDFGDGSGSSLSDPVHTYLQPGIFSVVLTGTGVNGCESAVSHPVTVTGAPQASVEVPDQVGCSPFTVAFSGSSDSGLFYAWDFGDGNTDVGEEAQHTFFNAGSEPLHYTVSLVVENLQLCADTVEMDIVVSPQPVSAFTLSAFETCYVPATVNVSNFSVNALAFAWFIDGVAESDLTTPVFTFNDVGTYAIELFSSNQYGCVSSASAAFNVYPLPAASMAASPLDGCVDLMVNFNNQSEGAQAYLWDFGDGNTSQATNPVHVYASPGIFDVTLVAVTDMGCSDTLVWQDYVEAYNLPIADFVFTPQLTNIYQPVITFNDDSFDASAWYWSFGDGSDATLPNVQHTYAGPGNWPVHLTVWNEHGCSDDAADILVINDVFDVFVPNAFTPDGDDINEYFIPVMSGTAFIERYSFMIFDRWGTVIFATEDPTEAWTGDVRDGEYFARDGVYNWQVKVQLKAYDEQRLFQGHVVLIR